MKIGGKSGKEEDETRQKNMQMSKFWQITEKKKDGKKKSHILWQSRGAKMENVTGKNHFFGESNDD